MRELIEKMEVTEEAGTLRAKNVEQRVKDLGGIPASAKKASQQLEKGNIAGFVQGVADILADVSRACGILQPVDEEFYYDLSKWVDKAYSAANKKQALPKKMAIK